MPLGKLSGNAVFLVRPSWDDVDRLMSLRLRLRDALKTSPHGPVSRAALVAVGFNLSNAAPAEVLERRRQVEIAMAPGMPPKARQEAYQATAVNEDVRAIIRLWRAVGALMADDGPALSGWLAIGTTDQGDPGVTVQGRAEISKVWQAPMLVIDAILDPSLVRPYYPNAPAIADIAIETPHQQVTQVHDRAYAKGRLVTGSNARPSDLTYATNNQLEI